MINQLYTWLRERKHLVFLIILLGAIYWKWWLPGPRVANDFPAVSLPDLKNQFDIPRVWFLRGSIGLGGYSVFTLWSWPMDFIAGAFSNVGLTFEILERAMFIIPILLIGVYSVWNLLHDFRLSKVSKFLGSLFYLTNTYILLLIDGGQLGIGLAYAWFPASYYFFLKSVDGKIKNKIISGLSLWLLGIFDIRFLYILGLLLIIRFLYEIIFLTKSGKAIRTTQWVKSGLISGMVILLLNTYWILPFLKYPVSSARIADLTKNSGLNFTEFRHASTLLQPHWYENVFGRIPPFRKEFVLIPALALLAPILKKKNREVWFWTAVALVSVFLTKGANPPFGEIYNWLFIHLPGFSLFRDSTKFFFLVALSYSVLIAFTVDEIAKILPKYKIVFPVLLILYLLFLVRPVYLGKMTGTFSEPRYKNEYFSLADKLEEDKNFGRIFWIPSKAPLGFSSPTHPTVEASRLESIRPFAVATIGSFETQNFIREGNYMGELFDIAGIRYVAYPYFDPKRDDMSKEKVDYYNTFLGQISTLPWIEKEISDIPIPVFKTEENEDKLFLSENTHFVVGSDRIYSEIKDLGGKFRDNAFIFAEENPNVIKNFEKTTGAKVILNDKNLVDLSLSLVDSNKFISPSSNLGFSPDKTSWWKRESIDLVWFRDFLQQKYGIDNLDFDYGQGWAIAEGEKELSITNDQFTKGNILYARVMNSSRGGTINFYQGDDPIGKVDTKIAKPETVTIKLTGDREVPDKLFKYDKADFHWVRVGGLVADKELTIKTEGDVNIVNSLVVLSTEEENSLSQKTENFVAKGQVIDWEKLTVSQKKELLKGRGAVQVSYQTLAPTHYKVKIEGLENPSTLVFSETFDNGWELNSKKGYKLYSFINGFWVEKDGEYDLYFAPQKYVIPGLVVSGLTLTSCIMFLVWKSSKRSS